MWALSARFTNGSLLVALLVAFGTGAGAMAAGTASGRWVVIAHGVAAMMVILLVPWKSLVVRRGLRRRRPGRHASLLLAALLVITLLAGLGYSTGVVRSVGGLLGMWVHVAAALTLVPLVVWHVLARRVRPRRSDLSRRMVLRAAAIAAVAAGAYAVLSTAVVLARLPGARRRFTGSYETGSFRPEAMPTTIWLDDSVPAVDPGDYRLVVADAAGRRELSVADLAPVGPPVRAILDCTSGWYAEQDWSGVPVSALLRDIGTARSLLVHSITGYWVRLPVDDLDGLLLATAVGGTPLTPDHGYPVRLVAPGRRGFWWVKWVDRLELQAIPWWWQSPFPLT
jgi:DMSO/TMAO reductase YedYZ molybdopterin-dependent catalytic subunit